MHRIKNFFTPFRGQCDVAFLQYTSGSTSEPKGVIITQNNLSDNLELITTGLSAGTDTVVVSWLPQYHDMGLIGSYLGAIYCGGSGYYLSPISFIRSPSLWVTAMSRSVRLSVCFCPSVRVHLCLLCPFVRLSVCIYAFYPLLSVCPCASMPPMPFCPSVRVHLCPIPYFRPHCLSAHTIFGDSPLCLLLFPPIRTALACCLVHSLSTPFTLHPFHSPPLSLSLSLRLRP